MTTRRWMLAVAVVALIAGGTVECQRRRARFHQLAMQYAQKELALSVFSYSGPGGQHEMAKQWQTYFRKTAPYRAYYAGLSKKYRRAEKNPWLPVAPDPPRPK
jgi:hypothetical protein